LGKQTLHGSAAANAVARIQHVPMLLAAKILEAAAHDFVEVAARSTL